MSLTQEQIAHIARLSRLSLPASDAEKFRHDLSSVVDYVDQLGKIPASALEGVSVDESSVLPLRADDEASVPGQNRAALLKCSSQKVLADQIAIPNIMG